MSTPAAPKRCLDALPENDALHGALAAAVRDRPNADFDRVYRGVIAVGGGAGGLDDGGGSASGIDLAAGATKAAASGAHAVAGAAVTKLGGGIVTGGSLLGGAFAKTIAIGLFGAASVGTAWWVGTDTDRVPGDEPVRAVASAPVASTSVVVVAPPPPAAPPAAAPSASSPPAQASAPEPVDPDAEMSLLREAGGAISSDPARALSLVDEAERRFAKSALGQEREVIRIQALSAAGRRDEALQRARALLSRNPSSAHRPRLEQILPELAP